MPAAQSSYVDLHDQICTNQIKELPKHKLALKKKWGVGIYLVKSSMHGKNMRSNLIVSDWWISLENITIYPFP